MKSRSLECRKINRSAEISVSLHLSFRFLKGNLKIENGLEIGLKLELNWTKHWLKIGLNIDNRLNQTQNTGCAINFCEISPLTKNPQFWTNFLKVGIILFVINGSLCWYTSVGFWTIFETCKACKTRNLKILFYYHGPPQTKQYFNLKWTFKFCIKNGSKFKNWVSAQTAVYTEQNEINF